MVTSVAAPRALGRGPNKSFATKNTAIESWLELDRTWCHYCGSRATTRGEALTMPKTKAEFCNYFVVARLIHEVKIRPYIWNTTDKDYNYRQHKAAAWEGISRILDIREDLVRMKWKNLRDFFKRIIRQSKVRDVDDYTGGWRYFKMLWFINQPDLLQNDGDSSDEATNMNDDEDTNTNSDETTNTNSDEATNTINELVKCEPEEFSETEVFTEEPVPIPEEKLATNSDDDDYDQMFLKKGARNSDDDHDQMILKKRATNSVDNDYDQMFLKKRIRNSDDDYDKMFLKKRARNSDDDDHDQMMLKKRATNSDDNDYNQMFLKKRATNSDDDDHDQMMLKKRATNSDDNDYNQMFLRSLTPYFKQLEPIRKLVIRNKIQEILLKELATQKNSSNNFC